MKRLSLAAPARTNAATRWLYTRAAARVVTNGDAPEKELAERMENIYRSVSRG